MLGVVGTRFLQSDAVGVGAASLARFRGDRDMARLTTAPDGSSSARDG